MTINKRVVTILIILVIIRIAMATALIYGFPEKGNYAGGYFYSGDDDEYEHFKLAFSLAKFRPVDSYRTLGLPILLLPFIWITKADSFERLLLPVGVFHACILAPLSIILVTLIAKRLTQEWKTALFSATLWTFFPYLVYIFVHTNALFCKDVPAMRMARQMWVQAVSDPPSTFLVLLGIHTFIVSLDKKNVIYPLLTGISFGLATLVRPSNIVLVLLFLSFYLCKKKLRALFLFIGSSFFAILPQFIYNWHFYGSPVKFTTLFLAEKLSAAERSQLTPYPLEIFSIRNYLFFIQQVILKFPLVLLLSVLLILLMITYTLFRLYKKSRRDTIILILWILPYLIIYGSYYDFCHSILHLLMPIIPALIIVISIALRGSLMNFKIRNG